VAERAAKPERCHACYEMRLERTAATARQFGLDSFSTTLLISPYQDHALLRQVGEAAGARYGIPFHYEDLRTGWPQRGRLTREYGLYRQQYCGCIYSEWERYGDAEARKARFRSPPRATGGKTAQGNATD
jgi:epoxyqueuosine reductase